MTETLTFPGIDPATALDGARWNFAPEQREQCSSRFYGHPQAPGSLWCCVDHAETGTTAHGVYLGPHFFTWTDAMAAASLLAQTWTCLWCGDECLPKPFRGCCSALHARLEHDGVDADEQEVEVAA